MKASARGADLCRSNEQQAANSRGGHDLKRDPDDGEASRPTRGDIWWPTRVLMMISQKVKKNQKTKTAEVTVTTKLGTSGDRSPQP